MDKNFIRIDDLVRQRMGGGEENERSGAWLNMRELLDKEMPQQRRIGIFYWRRLFSVVAALSLIGTVCVGSYDFSSLYRSHNGNVSSSTIADATTANNEASNIFALPANAATTNEPENNKNRNITVRNNEPSLHRANHTSRQNNATQPITYSAKAVSAGATTANTGVEKPIIDNPIIVDNKAPKKTRRSNNITNKKQNAGENSNVVAAKDADGDGAIGSANQASVNGSATDKQPTVQNSNTLTGDAKTPVAKVPQNGPATLAQNASNTPVPATVAVNKTTQTVINEVVPTGSSVAANVATGKATGTSSKDNTTNVPAAANTLVTADKAISDNNTSAAIAKVDRDNHQANKSGISSPDKKEDKMVLNSSTSAVKNTATAATSGKTPEKPTHNTNKIASSFSLAKTNLAANVGSKAIHTSAPKKQSVLAANTNKTTYTTGGGMVKKMPAKTNKTVYTTGGGNATNVTAKGAGAKLGEKDAISTYSTGGAMAKNKDAESINYNKKVVLKLLLHERLVKTGENKDDYTHKLDTISKEWVDMALGKEKTSGEAAVAGTIEEKNSPAASTVAPSPKARGARSGGTRASRRNSGANSSSSANTGATTPEEVAGTSATATNTPAVDGATTATNNAGTSEVEIMPAAGMSNDASAAAKAEGSHADATDAKTKTATKKGSGISLLKRLSLAFNDVKTNASTAQFVPGIVAGINSNFFGPNSFKGFQFGVTGNLVFNDTWNLMTELKYFQRINNNSAIQDNYYEYTQVGANQYRKDLKLNSYGFSALHSLEIPVSIRYSKGNFNFFTGGNFLYAFSINTGASTVPDYNAQPEFVNQIGTDNAPKFNEQDFRSRFGLGYLFGFSYQVAPNFNIDLRNVQTVWDNAASTGAKSVSAQLFKSPSLQLSIMYRLGGNRHKD